MKKFKWTVEFEVDETWVADGFDLDDDRALTMLARDLRHAHIGSELDARVIKSPSKKAILNAQGSDK